MARQTEPGLLDVFGSRSLAAHLARGAAGGAAAYLGFTAACGEPSGSSTAAALGLGAAALVLFRGCPLCWTLGLVQMLRGAAGRERRPAVGPPAGNAPCVRCAVTAAVKPLPPKKGL